MKQTTKSTLLLLYFSETVTALFFGPYPVDFAPLSILETGPWIFGGNTVELPISVDKCWSLLTDQEAWPIWFPEISNIRVLDPPEGAVFRRKIDFGGNFELDESFDVWEDTGDSRRMSFYLTATNRPSIVNYKQFREEYKCTALTESSTEFTLTVAGKPGFIFWLLGFLLKSPNQTFFGETVPNRLLESVKAGDVPLME